jgi:PKD repeat protein
MFLHFPKPKLFLGVILTACFSLTVQAQVFTVPFSGSASSASCTGTIYDHGGASGSYGNGANGTFVINTGGVVTLTFTTFSTESCCDYLYIYDGLSTSAPLIGSYRGSGLPNGGTVSGTGNGLTLRFVTDGSVTSAGFAASWGANSITTPTADLQTPPASVAYNTPVQFTSNSTNANSFLWLFGDGQTSTDENPVHRYTASGSKDVRVVAYNCLGSDTSSIKSVVVQPAPNGTFSSDTVKFSLACGTSGATNFSVSNQASGNLNYNLSLETHPSQVSFQENFESSPYNFSSLTTGNTITYPTTGAPQGNAYLSLTGNNYYNPVVANIPPAQPSSVSYYVKSDNYASYHGQFGVGSGNINAQELLLYSVFRYADLRIYYRSPAGFTTVYYHPQTDGQWYHLELRNIDWTARTYDLYIDNVLIVADAQMYSTQVNAINFMYFNNSNFSTSGLDAVMLGGIAPSSVFTFNPSSGNLGNGSSNTIFVNANAAGLNAGTYYFNFLVQSNDTALDGTLLPIELEVTGTADLNTDKVCSNLGAIYNNIAYVDSVLLYNTGCDTLNFSSISSTNIDIVASTTSLNLAPDDSAYVRFDLNTSTLGALADTIHFTGPDTNFAYCFSAQVSGAPSIQFNQASYTVNHTGCTDTASFQLIMTNTGLDTLYWGTGGSYALGVSDDFESSTFNTNTWGSWGSGVVLNGTCGTIAGTNSLLFNGFSDRWIVTRPLNLLAGGTIEFDLQFAPFCNYPESGDGVTIEYSLDNGVSWNYISYHYYSTTAVTHVVQPIPAAAQSSNVKLRFIQYYFSGSTDNWLMDELSISAGIQSDIFTLPDTGFVAVGAFDTLDAYIDVNGLTTGTYNLNVLVASNDPQQPFAIVPVTLNLTGVPALEASPLCVALDTMMMNTSVTDSVLLYNPGCGTLNISSVTAASSSFSFANIPTVLLPGDSAYTKYTFAPTTAVGDVADSIVIRSDADTVKVCVTAHVVGAPQIQVVPDSVALTHIGCTDSAQFQLVVHNSGSNILNYGVSSSGGVSLTDDFEGGSYNTDLWDNSSMVFVGNSCAIINGAGGLIFNGSGSRYITSVPLDLSGGGSISMQVRARGNCETPDNGEGINIEYSTNNGLSWSVAYYHYTTSTLVQQVSVTLPVAAQSTNTRIRLRQNGHSGNGYDNWVVDDVVVQGTGSVANIYFVPDTGNVAINSYDTITGYIDVNGLLSGTHDFIARFASNDPLQPALSIPIHLNLMGSPEAMVLTQTCLAYTNVQQGAVATDTAFVFNAGCDTLRLTSASANGPQFTATNLPLSMAPGDTAAIIVAFSASTVGTFTDTLNVQNNDSTLRICLSATTIGAPFIALPKDTLEYELNKCKVVGYENFRINNTGLGAMNYQMTIGGFRASTHLSFSGTAANTVHSFSNVPVTSGTDTLKLMIVLHGDYDDYYERTYLRIDGSNQGYLVDNGLNFVNDTLYYTYYGTNVNNWTADGNLNISLENSFDVDGAAGSFQEVHISINKQVNWVSVVGSTGGTIAPNGGVNKNMLFNAALLPVGTHYTTLNIATNSPGTPNYSVPVIFNVVAKADIETTDTCLNFPFTLLGDTASLSFSLYNDGCDLLTINNVSSTSTTFKLLPNGSVTAVQIGDSVHYTVQFIPTSVGNFSAALLVNNSDEFMSICLNGNSGAKPVAQFTHSAEDPCVGEFAFIDQSQHTPSSRYWTFGDGATSTLANPIHNYTKPGTYKVTLRVNNAFGFDTSSVFITANPFYVGFGTSADTVELTNATVNFYDSSLTANAWNWNFGDGSTDNTQNPVHTYAAQGTYIVNLSATDARNCNASVTRIIVVRNTIGVEELALQTGLSLYPNPANQYVQVVVADAAQRGTIKVFGSNGKLITTVLMQQKQQTLDVSQLAPGMYQIQLFDASGAFVDGKKFMVNR